ncbi:hypothetical protein ACLBXM_18950 [Xanthobacteraceae bacterium A53D]
MKRAFTLSLLFVIGFLVISRELAFANYWGALHFLVLGLLSFEAGRDLFREKAAAPLPINRRDAETWIMASGRFYRTRGGQTVGPLTWDTTCRVWREGPQPWREGDYWHVEGSRFAHVPDDMDLIEEVPDHDRA